MIHVIWHDGTRWQCRNFDDWAAARHWAALEAPRPNIMTEGTVVFRENEATNG